MAAVAATGGDGSVAVGSAASLASYTTTITTNLNQSPASTILRFSRCE
jgi:hypothetical protein